MFERQPRSRSNPSVGAWWACHGEVGRDEGAALRGYDHVDGRAQVNTCRQVGTGFGECRLVREELDLQGQTVVKGGSAESHGESENDGDE